METLYSLRQIGPILARTNPNASELVINRQVRHWTVHNLLVPGKKHTGRGRDRTYTFHQIRKAAIYLDLARYGMTVGLLQGIGDWLDMLEETDQFVWGYAKEGRFRTFLQVTWTPTEDLTCGIAVHPDDVAKATRARGNKRGKVLSAGVAILTHESYAVMGIHSMVLVNLSSLFRSLDG